MAMSISHLRALLMKWRVVSVGVVIVAQAKPTTTAAEPMLP